MSDASKKLSDLNGPRAAARLLKLCREIDEAWDDASSRNQKLDTLATTLAEYETAKIDLAPQIFRLRTLLHPNMTHPQFWTVMVPIERAYHRQHVTDADIMAADDSTLTVSPFPLSLVLHNLRSAFNIGSIIRLAECVGAHDIHLVGYTANVDHPKVKHAAMGCDERLQIRHHESLKHCLSVLQADGCTWIAGLETHEKATRYTDVDWQWPGALVVGNERFGLESAELEEMDAMIRVPVFGQKNSLNVVSALSVVTYQARGAWDG